MVDYWSKLKLNECWSNRERYNIILNYLDGKTTTEEIVEEPEPIEINVCVKDGEGEEANGIGGVSVEFSQNNTVMDTGNTGGQGGCKIHVISGEYSVTATKEGYVTYTDTFTVSNDNTTLNIVLTQEETNNTEEPKD